MTSILFYSEAWGRGGIETFVRNVSPSLVSKGFRVDIVSTWDWQDAKEDNLERIGIRRFTTFHGNRPNQLKRVVYGLKTFSRLLGENNYDVVWINTMNGVGMLYAWVASRNGVPIRVVHSHNSDVGEGMKLLKRAVGKLFSLLFGSYSTVNVACSIAAGDYLFCGKRFILLPNGIDIDHFRFSETARNQVRQKLGIESSETLVGNIGRVYSQKNPLFQIKVFAEYHKMNSSSRYLMLGRQDMAKDVLLLARKLGVSDSLILLDAVDDPAPYYSALDVFLMPSLYEGFGFAKIEAQCASLPLLCSDVMPSEADVTELVKTLPLSILPTEWAKCLSEITPSSLLARDPRFADEVSRSGFSLQACVDSVLSILSQCDDVGK